jgi:hypothetical protein
MSRILPVILWVCLLSSFGCSKAPTPPATVPVSGRVTLGKAPLASATVEFRPIGDDKSGAVVNAYGTTDSQGHFTMKLGGPFADVAGVPTGKYRVHIGRFDREAKSGPQQLVPARYNRASQLTFEVAAGGTTEANFDLASK